MKRKANDEEKRLATQVSARLTATRLASGLRQQITTYETLRRYEEHYNRIEPHLSGDQQHYLMTQFARHEHHLGQRNRLPDRPSKEEEKTADTKRRNIQQTALNLSLSHPIPLEDVDPFALEDPTAAGIIRRKRKRMVAEEQINWDLFDFGPQPPPPPPPPPSGGGQGIMI